MSSSSSKNHFHMTLPCNASMDIYPNNTTAQYSTKLPRPIELDDGDWNVSLKDISTPILFDNVPPNTCNFKLIGLNNSTQRELDMSLPGKMYNTMQSVIDDMDRLTNPYYIEFGLKGIKAAYTVSIIVGHTHIFRLNKQLSSLLGIYECDYIKGEYLTNRRPKL